MTLMPTFLLTLSSIFVAVSGTNCDNLGILVYEDLGCTPRYKNNGSCPEEYSCDGLEEWTDKCHYRGKTYSDGESVPPNEKITLCIDCKCEKRPKPKFACNYLDCFGNVPTRGCKNIFPVDEGCCPPVEKCPPFVTCEVDGRTYEEGDVFYLLDKCVKCQCGKGFKVEEPFCKRHKCGEQLTKGEYIQKKCAPLYWKSKYYQKLCCPKTWICPDGTETFKKATEGCMFGEQIVEKGQNFTKEIRSEKVICQCLIPPLLTCKEVF